MKLKCPICDVRSVSVWRKLTTGPVAGVQCKSCNNIIGVPWLKSILSFVPAFGVGYLAWWLIQSPYASSFPWMANISTSPETWAAYGTVAGTVIITIPLYLYWVPLKLKRMCWSIKT